jgi:hypothetical protein
MPEPQKIEFELCDFLDRETKHLEDKAQIRYDNLKEKYLESEARLEVTKRELEKRTEATYATIREVDAKIDRRDTRIYTMLIATFALLGGAILAHVLGKL